jgi:hypothetical protein
LEIRGVAADARVMDASLPLAGVAAAPLITALVAAVGMALPAVPRRLYPVLAIAVGVTWNVALAWNSGDALAPLIFGGVVAGLAASGLYSGAVKPIARTNRQSDSGSR